MYAYKFKELAKRGSALLGAAGMLAGIGTTALPVFVSADALNPLTERSLTLSSSSPGWSYLDGSNNTLYAPPHSGANGQKTGETFSFRFSSINKTIKAITFQFCTTPAGSCISPGDNGHNVINDDGSGTAIPGATADITSGSTAVVGTNTVWNTGATKIMPGATIKTPGGTTYTVASVTDDTHLDLTANASATETGIVFGYENVNDTATTSDLNVVTASPSETDSTAWTAIKASDSKTAARNNSQGNFAVLHEDSTSGPPADWDDYTLSSGWSMSKSNSETGSLDLGNVTGKNNLITITNSTPGEALSGTTGDYWKVIFFGTDTNYITNPGSGAFFVRMNTYSDASTLDDSTLVDGGVTVANVMNQSITIQTKVLETMDFSVGVHDPDVDDISAGGANYTTNTGLSAHGMCDPILTRSNPAASPATYAATPQNVLKLGDSNAEYSLKTNTAYDQHSYWRLSSNSSGGATVYYTGHTLTNTENDQITPLTDGGGSGTGWASQTGTEQFGLAIDHGSTNLNIGPNSSSVESYPVGDTYDSAFTTLVGSNPDVKYHAPRLYPLVPTDPYGGGNGTITSGGTAKFSFNPNADTYAIPLASETTEVVNCVTAKMRYIANIAATTPAGIYTTKVNYVASPQY